MNRRDFEHLCRSACLELDMDDPAALEQGFSALYEGVLFEAVYREGHESFVLLVEMGEVPVEHKRQVYESLLTMQLLTWEQPGVRFGFNPVRQTAVLCIETSLGPRASGAWLAKVMRSSATQVTQWRQTLLQGEPI